MKPLAAVWYYGLRGLSCLGHLDLQQSTACRSSPFYGLTGSPPCRDGAHLASVFGREKGGLVFAGVHGTPARRRRRRLRRGLSRSELRPIFRPSTRRAPPACWGGDSRSPPSLALQEGAGGGAVPSPPDRPPREGAPMQRLYLEDLASGSSSNRAAEHRCGRHSRPSRGIRSATFNLDEETAKPSLFGGLGRAAGTRRA